MNPEALFTIIGLIVLLTGMVWLDSYLDKITHPRRENVSDDQDDRDGRHTVDQAQRH